MKTPKNFEYNLWSVNEDSQIKFFVRIKKTGEITQVDLPTMQFLRNEEKKSRRLQKTKKLKIKGNESVGLQELDVSFISLDTDEFTKSDKKFLIDKTNFEHLAILNVIEKEILQELNSYQKEIYINCLKYGISNLEFSKRYNVTEGAIRSQIKSIYKITKNKIENI